jgi:signal transduction histidine kinase
VVDVLNEIRQLSFTMKPPQFQSSSLSEAMEQLVTHMHYAGKLQILTDFNGLSEEALEDSHRLLVYRVVQEQLQNIVKHAGARQVRIRLHNNRESMHILVKDDGRGFDKSSQQHGIGLRNMRNRLEAFAGHMQIHTAPGEGCRMEAVFHLN